MNILALLMQVHQHEFSVEILRNVQTVSSKERVNIFGVLKSAIIQSKLFLIAVKQVQENTR